MANGGTWKDKVHRAQDTRAQMEGSGGSGGAHSVYGKDREAPDPNEGTWRGSEEVWRAWRALAAKQRRLEQTRA